MVPGYRHLPGNHCGSTALRNLLAHHGVEISEEMALGLGAGVSFYYVQIEGQSPSRFTNGRGGKLEAQFIELTGAPIRLETFESPDASWRRRGPPSTRAAPRFCSPTSTTSTTTAVGSLPRSRGRPRGLRLRGRLSVGHRIRGASDHPSREPRAGATRQASGVRARGPHAHDPEGPRSPTSARRRVARSSETRAR